MIYFLPFSGFPGFVNSGLIDTKYLTDSYYIKEYGVDASKVPYNRIKSGIRTIGKYDRNRPDYTVTYEGTTNHGLAVETEFDPNTFNDPFLIGAIDQTLLTNTEVVRHFHVDNIDGSTYTLDARRVLTQERTYNDFYKDFRRAYDWHPVSEFISKGNIVIPGNSYGEELTNAGFLLHPVFMITLDGSGNPATEYISESHQLFFETISGSMAHKPPVSEPLAAVSFLGLLDPYCSFLICNYIEAHELKIPTLLVHATIWPTLALSDSCKQGGPYSDPYWNRFQNERAFVYKQYDVDLTTGLDGTVWAPVSDIKPAGTQWLVFNPEPDFTKNPTTTGFYKWAEWS